MTMKESNNRLFLTIDDVKEMSQRDPGPRLTDFEASALIYTCALLHENVKLAASYLTRARMLFDLSGWPIPPEATEAEPQ